MDFPHISNKRELLRRAKLLGLQHTLPQLCVPLKITMVLFSCFLILPFKTYFMKTFLFDTLVGFRVTCRAEWGVLLSLSVTQADPHHLSHSATSYQETFLWLLFSLFSFYLFYFYEIGEGRHNNLNRQLDPNQDAYADFILSIILITFPVATTKYLQKQLKKARISFDL